MTTLEKVARAIAGSGLKSGYLEPPASPSEVAFRYARAAIEALREPSEGMIDMGQARKYRRSTALNIWEAMIDYILAEKPDE